MNFTKIDACLVCEGARAELYNKYVLLGYYGLAPHVKITIADFKSPVMLCFVFSGGGGRAGTYTVGITLTDPTGHVVSNPMNAPDATGPLGDRVATNIFLSFHGLLGAPGVYRVALNVNFVEHFSTTLDIVAR